MGRGGQLGKRVLVVEDNTFLREAVTRVLAAQGYAVAAAADGREALSRLRARPPESGALCV